MSITPLAKWLLDRYKQNVKRRSLTKPFISKYNSRCSDCGGQIFVGNRIQLILVITPDRKWIKNGVKHEHCFYDTF